MLRERRSKATNEVSHRNEPVYADDDSVEIRFTLLDYLRMLAGLAMLYCLFHKCLYGVWIKLPSFRHQGMMQDTMAIPEYWSKFELPKEFTLAELAEYSGTKENERILLSVKGRVFDVTRGSSFYGKWGAYRKFTGTDCSNIFGYSQWDLSALAKECEPGVKNLSGIQLERIDAWLQFFQKKYPEIGYVQGIAR